MSAQRRRSVHAAHWHGHRCSTRDAKQRRAQHQSIERRCTWKLVPATRCCCLGRLRSWQAPLPQAPALPQAGSAVESASCLGSCSRLELISSGAETHLDSHAFPHAALAARQADARMPLSCARSKGQGHARLNPQLRNMVSNWKPQQQVTHVKQRTPDCTAQLVYCTPALQKCYTGDVSLGFDAAQRSAE